MSSFGIQSVKAACARLYRSISVRSNELNNRRGIIGRQPVWTRKLGRLQLKGVSWGSVLRCSETEIW